MTTIVENNEMVDSKHADIEEPRESETETSQIGHSVKLKPGQGEPEPMDMEMPNSHPPTEQVDSQTVGEQLEPEHASTELAHPKPLSEDKLDTTLNYADDVRPQTEHNGEQADPQTVSEQADIRSVSEQADLQTINEQDDPQTASEQGDLQTVGEQDVHPKPLGEDMVPTALTNSVDVHPQSEHINAEQTHSHSVSLNAIQSQPDKLQPSSAESNEMVDSELAEEHPRESEYSNTQADDTLIVKSERVEPKPMDMEEANFQPGEEHQYTELAHPESLGEEIDYRADQMHSEPVASESMPAQIVNPEILHPQAVSADLVHPQAVSSELVHLPYAILKPVDLQPNGVELLSSHGHGTELVNSQAVGMELVNTQQPLSTEIANTQLTTPETQSNKRRKKKSIVWEHFTIESVGEGCRRAYCKVCKQSFAYSTGSKVAGTSHLKRHIAKGTCPVVLRQQEKNQLSPYVPKSGGTDASTERQPKRRYRSSSSTSTPYVIFDQDRCRQEIAKMIIMHDYPLHMVEHSGFVSFVHNLQPRFDMVSFNIVQGDCVAMFLREKQKLQRFIEGIPGRICLTLDLWTSSQSSGYVFVTGQFIDNDWKLHRRLLNVVMEPFPESDRALSHAIGTCLSDWGLDRKLASITFNQPLGENALDQLRALLAVKNPMLLNGQLLIRNCIARTLSNMAQEVIASSDQTIKKIRTGVKYVKPSESNEEKFLELKQQLRVPTEKSLSLDNITKWNTTYEMLLAASELKQVFSCLDTYDPDYKDAPSNGDWTQVENIIMYLKLFYDTANLLLAKPTPSSNVFFHEVWKIQLELARAAASDDLFVAGLAKPLQEKFHKYWKNTCLVLAVAVAMDPRFKMKLVEFSFTKIFMDEAPVYIRIVDEGIHELFHEYVTFPPPSAPHENNNDGGNGVEGPQGGNLINSNGLSDFDVYIMETSSQQMKSELDQYLEESLLPRVQDFDVLGWWKLNKLKYPTLSQMARDILSVPLSTVSPDAVFDTSPKEMDSYHFSLRSETLEALICAKDWLQSDPIDVSKDSVKMEL